MKVFILILLSTILFSCGDDLLITRTHNPDCDANSCRNYYEVGKIENRGNNLCRYYLVTTGYDWASFDSKISFVDSIGKFEISEKLYVSFDRVK